MKINKKNVIWAIIIVLMIVVLGYWQATKKLSKDDSVLAIAQDVVVNDLHHFAKIECLDFSATKEGDFVKYTVVNKFSTECPGQADSAPVVPIIKINSQTKEVFIMGLDGEFDKLNKTDNNLVTSDWKTYTSTKDGYSFEYPIKLSLSTSETGVYLSHSIPFENRDGGCDMKGDSEISKTLGDFNLSIEVVSGAVVPPYVDGTYAQGALNGKWAYMGAEGCGQTKYYFPVSGNRTLVITKNELQILSPVVTPEVRAKVLAVPGVISYEESKTIVDRILSTFKFTSPAVKIETPKPVSITPSITVLSPKGGETYKIGSKVIIKWNEKYGKDMDDYTILLDSTNNTSILIADNYPVRVSGIDGTGSYEWTIPQLNTNGKYKIEVYRATARELTGRSGEFTITN